MSLEKCPICKIEKSCEIVDYGDSIICNCIKCGHYKMSGTAHAELKYINTDFQKLSSWISEQNKIYNEYMPYIDSDKIELILMQRDKTIREKFHFMMKALSKFARDSSITLKQINESYIVDNNEFQNLLNKAKKEGFIQSNMLSFVPEEPTLFWKGFTFEGHEFIESLDEPNKNSNKVFMAFWFEPAIQKIFDNVVKPAIDNIGFLAERVSSSTTSLENKISDEIIGMIKSSRVVIADCTGNRTAVYYEAGYAMGMKIPVIWTCRADEVEKICFDVSQHPFILWNTPEELADKVVKRLKAIL